jgi:kumamolisin
VAGTHVTVAGSGRVPLPGARALGRTNPNSQVEVTVKVRRKRPLPPLEGRPASHMTRQALAETYGATAEDIAKVVETFAGFGLKSEAASAATRSVRFSGNVVEMEKAFLVTLFNYAHPQGNYRGRVGSVQVPAEVKDIVQGVFGLDNRRVVRRRRQPVRDASLARAGAKVPSSWYIPSELASHYSFPPGDGAGQAVGLLEFGGGYFDKDLELFCKLAGVGVPKVLPVSTDGTPTNAHDGEEGEVMLDIEIVSGLCPKSSIVVYFAQFDEQGWITILDAVMKDAQNDPGVVSCSWGLAEDTDVWTHQAQTQVNESLQEAAHLGITVCVAAGDDGSSDAVTDGKAHVDFPGSSPYVLSVGGTTIPKKGGAGADIVWKEGDGLRADNGGSTGGGVSTVFARPSWQSGVKIKSVDPGAIVGRCVPDLAANADWDASPYLLVVDGKSQANGGTSAATPLCAALVGLINAQRGAGKRIGYLTPLLYQADGGGTIGAAGCTDVVSGDNNTDKIGGYSAGPGYDAVSGWGTPNGKKLLAALAGK